MSRFKITLLVLLALLILSSIIWLLIIPKPEPHPDPPIEPCCAFGCLIPCVPDTIIIPPDIPEPQPTMLSRQQALLTGQILTNEAILINYKLPVGSSPKSQKAMLGLWEGKPDSTNKPILRSTFTDDRYQGALPLESPGKEIEAIDYTVAYFFEQTADDDTTYTIVSTLQFGANLPLNEPGKPSPLNLTVISTGNELILFQIDTNGFDSPDSSFVAVVSEPALPKGHTLSPDPTGATNKTDYYKKLTKADIKPVPSPDVVSAGSGLYLLNNYGMRLNSRYTLIYGVVKDQDPVILATATFQATFDLN